MSRRKPDWPRKYVYTLGEVFSSIREQPGFADCSNADIRAAISGKGQIHLANAKFKDDPEYDFGAFPAISPLSYRPYLFLHSDDRTIRRFRYRKEDVGYAASELPFVCPCCGIGETIENVGRAAWQLLDSLLLMCGTCFAVFNEVAEFKRKNDLRDAEMDARHLGALLTRIQGKLTHARYRTASQKDIDAVGANGGGKNNPAGSPHSHRLRKGHTRHTKSRNSSRTPQHLGSLRAANAGKRASKPANVGTVKRHRDHTDGAS